MLFTDTLLTKLGQSLHDAQALNAEVFRNGQLTSLAVDFSTLTIGTYRYAFTIPENWQPHDQVSVHFTYRLADFNATTSKTRLGSVSALRARDPSLTVANDVANAVITATKSELAALTAEIASQSNGHATYSQPAQPIGKLKRLRATGRIAKISGAKTV